MLPTAFTKAPWVPARTRKVLSLDGSEPMQLTLSDAERAQWLDRHAAHTEDPLAAMPEDARLAHIQSCIEQQGILLVTATRNLHGEALRKAIRAANGQFLVHYGLLRRAMMLFGFDALPLLDEAEARAPQEVAFIRQSVASVATARALFEKKTLENYARYQPRVTLRALLPIALGAAGPLRERAVKQIQKMSIDRALVERVADEFGSDARTELDVLLAPPPLPPKGPKWPQFVSLEALPTLRLKDGEVVTQDMLRTFVELLSLLPLDAARPAIEEIVHASESNSLAALSEALMAAWVAIGAPTKEKWVVFAAGLLGGDDAARRLIELAETWMGAGFTARAGLAIEAVGSIGSDVALLHLHRMATRSRSKPLKKRAQAALDAICEERGWSAEDVADRTVPHLGLDADGTITLDFGKRAVRIALDETLSPIALDEAGRPLPSLPRANKADDAEKAKAAVARLQGLKADLKVIAQEQLRRLERALATERIWPLADFEARLLHHPVLVHLVRRLIWQREEEPGVALRSFRVADDGSFADVNDDSLVFEANPRARIRLAHPLTLGDETAKWATVLADYQLMQPFPQLQREVFALTEEEERTGVITRFAKRHIVGSRFFTLKHRGWDFSDYALGKTLADGVHVILETEGYLDFLGMRPDDQTLKELRLSRGAFSFASKVSQSELLRDVDRLSLTT